MDRLPSPAAEEIVPPFMNQIATLPLVSLQRMSLLPSPSKPPVSAIDQVVGTLPINRFETTVPLLFNIQIARLPGAAKEIMDAQGDMMTAVMKASAADHPKDAGTSSEPNGGRPPTKRTKG